MKGPGGRGEVEVAVSGVVGRKLTDASTIVETIVLFENFVSMLQKHICADNFGAFVSNFINSWMH